MIAVIPFADAAVTGQADPLLPEAPALPLIRSLSGAAKPCVVLDWPVSRCDR